MTFFFFLFGLLSLALAANVVRPNFYHPKWCIPSFLFGWLAGELALHVIAIQLSFVFLFVWAGWVKGFFGAVSLLLYVGAWIILAYHYFSGYKALVLMNDIVAPGRSKSDGPWSRQVELDSTRLSRPWCIFHDDGIDLLRNISYDQTDGRHLRLDIRKPRYPVENAPVLLQIHGGAWTINYGSKNEQGLPLMNEMARRGWICVAIEYRLSPRASFPDHIIDCKKALSWVRQHISEYGGNPQFIVVTGGSAGGHLSSLLTLTPNLAAFQPGFEDVDTRVQGCVPFYGIYDLLDRQKLQLNRALEDYLKATVIKKSKAEAEDLYRLMSPIEHINPDAPPFLIVHGDRDSLTCLGEAQYFASQLDEVSRQTVDFAEVPGAQHAFDIFPSIRSEYVMLGVAERVCQWHEDFQKKSAKP
jgi:acetyl esterase/lipase